jgi:2-polyprenyl-3-methyl-5-hydroxy-6-metoxy-1,4-benzoquinol methylase
MLDRGWLVGTRRLGVAEVTELGAQPGWGEFCSGGTADSFCEHEWIPFASYPHEWPPELLWAAARLTLDLARRALADGWGLKDATPQNVLFQGRRPVFIDLLSFERRTPEDPVWRPYGQFVRTFLLPLLAHRLWGTRLSDVFLSRRDGLEPEEVYRWCRPLTRCRPSVLSLVSLPTWLAGSGRRESAALYRQRTMDPEKARFILEAMFGRLDRTLARLEPRAGRDSAWSDYMRTHSYSDSAFAAKDRFVREALTESAPKWVLDVGANTGHFSRIAAGLGARVVAIDLDPASVGAMVRAGGDRADQVLPLVVNLARPSPALGWRGQECRSFLDRAAGRFDCVLMLAVLHHLLVTERIPLTEVLSLAAELTVSTLVIEFVAPADDMFRRLARGREHLHASLTTGEFETACAPWFEVVRSEALPETHRRIYLLRKRKDCA